MRTLLLYPQFPQNFWLWDKALELLETRWQLWGHLWKLARSHTDSMGRYIMGCAQLEHFLEYRQVLRDRISEQLTAYQNAS